MSKWAVKRRGPVVTEVVEGEPIHIEGRELVPVVRVTSRVQRQAFVGTDGLAGQGAGLCPRARVQLQAGVLEALAIQQAYRAGRGRPCVRRSIGPKPGQQGLAPRQAQP